MIDKEMDTEYLFDAKDNRIKYIADFFGCEKQSNKAIEELNELAVAIAHYQKRKGSDDRKNLIEEIADAEVMLSQIKYMYGVSQTDIDSVKRYKINRTIERLKNE